jgi:hypothetical protein
LQEELPHAGTLQKASYALQKWQHDDAETRSWQIAGAQHPDTVTASTSPPNSALLLTHAVHASNRQEKSSDSTGNDSSAPLEVVHASPKEGKVERDSVGKGKGESKSQESNETNLLCMHNATASKCRALVDPMKEIATSIEQLSSLHLDAGSRQPSVSESSGACRARLPKGPSPFAGAICSSQHDSNSVGESLIDEVDSMREVKGPLESGGSEGTSTCNSTNAGWIKRHTLQAGLLGESGQALKAVHGALKEIEDVHSSDELMHFEFFGPFWELSEV